MCSLLRVAVVLCSIASVFGDIATQLYYDLYLDTGDSYSVTPYDTEDQLLSATDFNAVNVAFSVFFFYDLTSSGNLPRNEDYSIALAQAITQTDDSVYVGVNYQEAIDNNDFDDNQDDLIAQIADALDDEILAVVQNTSLESVSFLCFAYGCKVAAFVASRFYEEFNQQIDWVTALEPINDNDYNLNAASFSECYLTDIGFHSLPAPVCQVAYLYDYGTYPQSACENNADDLAIPGSCSTDMVWKYYAESANVTEVNAFNQTSCVSPTCVGVANPGYFVDDTSMAGVFTVDVDDTYPYSPNY